MSNQKTFYIRNSGRNIPDKVKPYTPQYEKLGVDPVPASHLSAQNESVHIKASKPPQPATFGQYRRGVPNVGSIDSFEEMKEMVVDDLSGLDLNRPLIDNNDQYTVEAFENPASDIDWERSVPRFQPKQGQVRVQETTFQSSDEDFEESSRMVREANIPLTKRDPILVKKLKEIELEEQVDFHPLAILKDLDPDQYLLFVSGTPICSAPLKEIEEEVKDLLFGRHQLCKEKEIDENDILVVKKVPLKIGVFLED